MNISYNRIFNYTNEVIMIKRIAIALVLVSIQMYASLDTKHRAESAAAKSTGSAGSAASASTATAAMPIASDNKTALERAIDAHDMRAVRAHARKLSDEDRKKLIRYAAKKERPRMVLALVPKQSHESHEKGLKDCFFKIQDLTMQEYAPYRQAFVESQNKRIQRARGIYEQMVAHTTLDANMAMIIVQMLHPTVVEIQRAKLSTKELVSAMHPDLEAAIVAGDIQKFDKLVAAGWLLDIPNKEGRDPLTLAVHQGRLEIVKKIVGQIPFVPEQRRNKLKKIAEDGKHIEIAQLIAAAWPNQAQDDALYQACLNNQTGDFLQALAEGANPDAIVDGIQDYAGNRAMVHGVIPKFWVDAIKNNRLDHARLLLEEGFYHLDDLYTETPMSGGMSIVSLEDFAILFGPKACRALIEKALKERHAKLNKENS